MWTPLPELGWRYLREDSAFVVGEFLFRPGWVTLVAVMLVALLAVLGGAALTAELERALDRLVERRRAVLGTLVAGSAIASIALNLFVLGGHPHTQDEIAYLFQARTLAAGKLWLASPPDGLIGAFQTVFLIEDAGRWYGKYPFGWPAVLAPFAACGVDWLANPLLNALALWLLFGLLRRHVSEGWALAGVALLATSPFFVFMGASYLTHPLTLVLVLAIVEGVERLPGPLGCALVAAGTGFIHTVRPLDALAFGLAGYLVVLRRRAGIGGRGWLALVLAPLLCIALVLAYNHAMTGDFRLSPFLKHNPNDRPGFGTKFGTFGEEGHNAFKGVMNLAFNMVALSEDVYGWPSLALFVVLAGVVLPPVWNRLERVLLAMGALIALQYFTFMGHGIAFGPRYYHAWLPLCAVFTLRCGLEIERRFRVRARLALMVAMLWLLGLMTYWPARVDTMRDYFNVLSKPEALLQEMPADVGIVVVPAVRWTIRDLFDSYFGKNGIDLKTARPLFVRDGPWVDDGRLARAFPDRKIWRLSEAPVRTLIGTP